MTGALRGRRVLVPRGGSWGERVAERLRSYGAEPIVTPVIASADPLDVHDRDEHWARLGAGGYDWVFVTSATGAASLPVVPEGTSVAAVGAATAAELTRHGNPPAFVPDGPSSASALVSQWLRAHATDAPQRCLIVRSDLASATISDELELRRHDVDVCIAYRTIGVDLPADVRDALADGGIDLVLLTSLSVARELRRQVPGLSASLASIGPGTTHDAESLGFTISHTASAQSVDALLADLDLIPVEIS